MATSMVSRESIPFLHLAEELSQVLLWPESYMPMVSSRIILIMQLALDGFDMELGIESLAVPL